MAQMSDKKKTDFSFEGQMRLLWRATVVSFAIGGAICLIFLIAFQSLSDEEKKSFFDTIEKIEIQNPETLDDTQNQDVPPIDD